jgi:hypothetical protein
MKATSLKLLTLFFISVGVLSCSDDGPLPENSNVKDSNSGGSSSARTSTPQTAATSSASALGDFAYYRVGGGLEVADAYAPLGHVIVGIGASVNGSRNVDRIVLATRAVNTVDGTLGTVEYHGYGSVGQYDTNLSNCEVHVELTQPNLVITEVGVASKGSDMAHIWVRYRDYNPVTRRLGSTLYAKLYFTRQSGVTTQREFTLPSGQPADRLAVTGMNLGCSGATGQIDGFEVQYGLFQ